MTSSCYGKEKRSSSATAKPLLFKLSPPLPKGSGGTFRKVFWTVSRMIVWESKIISSVREGPQRDPKGSLRSEERLESWRLGSLCWTRMETHTVSGGRRKNRCFWWERSLGEYASVFSFMSPMRSQQNPLCLLQLLEVLNVLLVETPL